jgi:hypothetical protein
MSSDTPHPLAHAGGTGCGADIIHPSGFRTLMGAKLHILDNLLALHTVNDLFIWDWREGILYTHIACDLRWMTQFNFISKRYFLMIFSSEARIYLFEIEPRMRTDTSELIRPKAKIILSFPPIFTEAKQMRISTYTSPFVTQHPAEVVKPYPGSDSDACRYAPPEGTRIHVLDMELTVSNWLRSIYFLVVIPNCWLLRCLRQHEQLGQTVELGWDVWGKEGSQWFRTEQMFSGRRYGFQLLSSSDSFIWPKLLETCPMDSYMAVASSTHSLGNRSRSPISRNRRSARHPVLPKVVNGRIPISMLNWTFLYHILKEMKTYRMKTKV